MSLPLQFVGLYYQFMSMFNTNKNLTVITGKNFSGRSNYLKSIIGDTENSIYIGEQPASTISGIFPTVESEIQLHSNSANQELLAEVQQLFNFYGFEKHYDKNPFTLSGGEQTILAILSTLLLQSKKLAIDTTLEQLNRAWREPLLKAIQNGGFKNTEVLLADNRTDEYKLNSFTEKVVNNTEENKFVFSNPQLPLNFETTVQPQKIELSNIHFFYNKKHAIIKGLNLELTPSNIYHLKGSNGVGKTTLAKILTGILKIKSGTVLLNDKSYNPFTFPGQIVGYSFQNPDEQLFSSTIENEILSYRKNESTENTKRREDYLEMFGLQNIRKKHPAEMPFTIRKRISLASTLALDRAWYILDEPTLGQDSEFSSFLSQVLLELTKLGKGVIVISHSEKFVSKLNAKVLNLNNL